MDVVVVVVRLQVRPERRVEPVLEVALEVAFGCVGESGWCETVGAGFAEQFVCEFGDAVESLGPVP